MKNKIKFVVKQALTNRGTKANEWYVVEVAGNGEVVNTSQMYTRKSSAVRAAKRRAGNTPTYLPWEIVVED